MIFWDDLLQKGEEGGREAATRLHAAVQDHVARNLPQISHPKIITRIYANARGLSETCCRSGITTRLSTLDDFIRGFNSSKCCFDFVDCGSGKDRTDSKIHGGSHCTIHLVLHLTDYAVTEFFKIYLHNLHCHQIFLGCSHDNGYARLLEELLGHAKDTEKVTLLEGTPFERELVNLKNSFKVVKFQEIFRESKIPQVTNGTRSNSNSDGLNGSHPLTRIPSSSDTASSHSGPHKITTWASMTAAPFIPSAEPSPKVATAKPVPQMPGLDRNKFGQRIDKLDTSIPNEDVRRVKKLKLCNPFYLQGECKNKNCVHDHNYPLSKNDKKTLEFVARMTPCYYKTECDDATCIYGHRCPQNESDRKDCYYKEDCRFAGWGHGIETRVVKTTRV